MKNLSRPLSWFVFNGLFMFIAYLGIVKDTVWAWNVFRFVFWACVVIGTLGMFAYAITHKEPPKPSVPVWIDVAYDIALCLGLSAFGYFWYAGLWAWQIICVQSIRSTKPKPENKTKCSTQST